MVVEVRAGASMRAVARAHHVSLSTVQWWCRRAGARPVERVDWSDRSPIPGTVQRTESVVEDLVLALRRELKETSDLGEYGGRALHFPDGIRPRIWDEFSCYEDPEGGHAALSWPSPLGAR
jgi:hypothetical protein